MVLSFPVEVQEALRDHQSGRIVGVATYQDRVAELDVDASGSVSYQASGEIQADASILVKGVGDSLVPKAKTDLLAPYGQEVSLFRELVLRDSVWRIPLGVFRVTGNSGAFEDVRVILDTSGSWVSALTLVGTGSYSVPAGWSPVSTGLYSVPVDFPSAGTGLYSIPTVFVPGDSSTVVAMSESDLVMVEPGLWFVPGDASEDTVPGLYDPPASYSEAEPGLYEFVSSEVRVAAPVTRVVMGWSVEVELKDRFRLLQRAKFVDQKSPVPGNTMYEEIRRLALVPVQENPVVGDVAVPSDLVYEQGRLGAIRSLAELAGAVPHLTRQGVLTVRPLDAWADPVLAPVFDVEGTITWQDGMSDEFVNYVRAASTDDEFVGFASIDDDSDPLSVNRAGPSTFEHKSPLYTSKAAAQAGAETTLRRLRGRRSREVQVSCTPEALLFELGDVGWVRDPVQGRAVLGEVSGLEFPNDVTEPIGVTLIVAEEA